MPAGAPPGGADAAAAALAAELFAGLGSIRIRRMFGGAGVYADAVMFALIADGTVYLKADGPLAVALAAEGSTPFVHTARGRSVAMGYWRLPETAVDDADAALAWGRRALAVAATARPTPAPRRSARSRAAGGAV